MDTKKLYLGKRNPKDYIVIHDDFLNLSYNNCSVSEIVVENILEFVDQEDVVRAVNEWRRVLKVDGSFVIVFTDIVKAVFLLQRNVILHSDIQKLLIDKKMKTICGSNYIENLLAMRYPEFEEITYHPIINKITLCDTIMRAIKRKTDM